MKSAMTVSMALAVVFAMAAPAQAVLVRTGNTNLFFDNYESPAAPGEVNNGAHPGTWSDSSNISDVITGGSPGAFGGSQYLRINNVPNFEFVIGTLSAPQPGATAVHLETMYYPPSSVGNPSGASEFVMSLRIVDSAGTPIGGGNHSVNGEVYDPFSGGFQGIFFQDNEWNRIEYDYTVGSGTFQMTLTNSLGVQTTNLLRSGGNGTLGGFYIYRDHRITGNIYFDNVVPEPATFALMTLGGLMLIRRR